VFKVKIIENKETTLFETTTLLLPSMKYFKLVFSSCLFFLLLSSTGLKAQSDVVPDEYLVMLTNESHEQAFKKELLSLSSNISYRELGNISIFKIIVPTTSLIPEALFYQHMNALPWVKYVQPNHKIQQRNTIPNDPNYSTQWQYNNTGQNGGIAGVDLDAELAWDITTGGVTPNGDTIVIAIVDGGFQVNHSDLIQNIWHNHAEIPDNGIDDDNNGYIDDYEGWNPTTSSDNFTPSSHGTAVAGIVGGSGNNGIGVTGVNWNVKLMLLLSSGNEDELVESYSYAYDARKKYNETNGAEGAFVVATNSSFGINGGSPSDAPIWCAMYDLMGEVGILSAAATANANSNVDVDGDLPTTCPSKYLIAVTNIKSNDEKELQAGYGVEHIDIGSFGSGVYTTTSNNSYSSFGGTSGATPFVAGTVGLLYATISSLLPSMSMTDPANAVLLAKQVIIDGSEDNASIANNTASGKRLNLNGVLQEYLRIDSVGVCLAPITLNSSLGGGTAVNFEWDSNSDTHYFYYAIDGGLYDSILVDKGLTLTDLDTCVNIDWYVRAVCDTMLSLPSTINTLSNAGCCVAPSNFRIENVSIDSAHVFWDKAFGFQSTKLRWKQVNSNIWTDSLIVDTNSHWIIDLDSCVNYEVDISTLCQLDTLSELSNTLTFITEGCPTCYDTDYCEILAPSNSFEWVDYINIGLWEANTGKSPTGLDFYGNDFGELSLKRGFKYPLTYFIDATSPTTERVQIFIDYNNNKQFESNEMAYAGLVSSGLVISDSISISPLAVPGNTRMRVQLQWNTNVSGCNNVNYGEIEDYCINILPSSVGLKEITQATLDIYPNPTNGILFINNPPKNSSYSLFSTLGELVQQGVVSEKLDISKQPVGVYLLQIDNFTYRILKQH
jgi:serine protease